MRLARLELSGFKSFARKTTFLFDSPITAIVGPNGSGKSNVAESLRWVLGEQSLKSLRGKRGEDLIFNGGSSGSRLAQANVTIVFDNRDRRFNIDFDEVAITRRVHRDGVNEYLVNNSVVRLRDIQEMLSVVSLGSSGHHIISQGEADRILLASPTDRQAMIEDALGLRVYQWKLNEAVRKLEKTKSNILQVESLRREIAPHLKFLKKQVEKIEQSENFRQDLKAKFILYAKTEDTLIHNHEKSLKDQRQPLAEELNTIEVELGAINQKLAKAEEGDFVVVRKGTSELESVRAQRDGVAKSLGRLVGKRESLEENLKRLGEEKAKLIDWRTVDEVLESVSQKIRQARDGGDLSAIRHLLDLALGAIDGFRGTKMAESNHRDEVVSEIEKVRTEEARAEQELSELEEKLAKLTSARDAEMAARAENESRLRHDERRRYELETRAGEIRLAVSHIDGRLEGLEMRIKQLAEEVEQVAHLVNQEIKNYRSLGTLPVVGEDVETVQQERKREIDRLKVRLEDAGVESGDVLAEYRQASERDEYLDKELIDLAESRKSIERVMEELKERIKTEFDGGLKKINQAFQEFFGLMFGGGTAGLSLVLPDEELDGEEEDEEGIVTPKAKTGVVVDVNLPRKRIRGLHMLSGGERALTSIALLFAMSRVNPPPFLVLDETDAALDEANSKKYGDMVETLAKQSQLIVVTHNRETMSRAGVLYGVTMGADGVSHLLSVRFDEATVYSK